MRKICVQLVVAAALFISDVPASAQYWVPTTAPETNWWAMACSSNGNLVVAAGGQVNGPAPLGNGPIYLSTNSGQIWSPTSAPLTNWGSLACSADGTKIAAASGRFYHKGFQFGGPGPIYVSGDSGVTWTQTAAPIGDWTTIVSSADGTRLVAGSMLPTSGACIWTSTNSGMSWTPSAPPLTQGQCTSLALSADGTKLYAAEYSSFIYTSPDFGLTWNTSSPSIANWYAVTCSADGSRLAVGAGWSPEVPGKYSPIYISTDYGATWASSGSPAKIAIYIASSADGNVLLVIYGGHLYISSDAGASWSDTVNPLVYWGAVASSSDGSKLFAAANDNGTIYTYRSAPRLDISLSGSSIALSWPAYSTGLGLGQSSDPTTNFVVQYSTSPGGQTWTNLTATPTVVNLTDTLSVTPAGGAMFYRLRKAQ